MCHLLVEGSDLRAEEIHLADSSGYTKMYIHHRFLQRFPQVVLRHIHDLDDTDKPFVNLSFFLPGTASIPNIERVTLTLSMRTVALPRSRSLTNRRLNPERMANSA